MKNEQIEPEFSENLAVGTQLLQGQYTIEKYLNSGGFGITYLARNSVDRIVVIKECFPGAICRRSNCSVSARSQSHTTDFKSSIEIFVREARHLSRLSHPNIVGVHQVFEENNTAYMVIDYIEGRDMQDMIEDKQTKFKPEFIISTLTKLLYAVRAMHEKDILHRDISPDNILIDAEGEPILIDFGAAREDASKASRILSKINVIKDGYSPQEFYVSGAQQTNASDLYALAATMYHCISGEMVPNSQIRLAAVAEGGDNPYKPLTGQFNAYPQNFLRAIDKALEVIPKNRIQSAGEWLQMIDPEIAARSGVEGAAAVSSAMKPANSNKTPMIAAAVAAVVALGAGGYFLMGSGGDADAPAVAVATQPAKEIEAPKPVKTETAVIETAPSVDVAKVEEPEAKPIVQEAEAPKSEEQDADAVKPVVTAEKLETQVEEDVAAEVAAQDSVENAEPVEVANTQPIEDAAPKAEEAEIIDLAAVLPQPRPTDLAAVTPKPAQTPKTVISAPIEVAKPEAKPVETTAEEQIAALVTEDQAAASETEEQTAALETPKPAAPTPAKKPEVTTLGAPEKLIEVKVDIDEKADIVERPTQVENDFWATAPESIPDTQDADTAPIFELILDPEALKKQKELEAKEAAEAKELQTASLGETATQAPAKTEPEAAATVQPVQNAPTAPAANQATRFTVGPWQLDMPFSVGVPIPTAKNKGTNGFPVITTIAPNANLDFAGSWVKPGVVIYSINGELITSAQQVEANLNNLFLSRAPEKVSATVRIARGIKSPVEDVVLQLGFRRSLELSNGTVLEQRLRNGNWVLLVSAVGATETGLKKGDLILKDRARRVDVTTTDGFGAALRRGQNSGAEAVEFTVLRGGLEKVARLKI